MVEIHENMIYSDNQKSDDVMIVMKSWSLFRKQKL